jgi:hypothetical protein
MNKQKQKEGKDLRHSWRRTGKTAQELSFNQKGVITLAEEVNEKGHKRMIQVEYKSVVEPTNG